MTQRRDGLIREEKQPDPALRLEGRGYEGAGYGRGHYPCDELGGRVPDAAARARAHARADDAGARERDDAERPGYGYYGSGGSYGYGGAFEHEGQSGYGREPPGTRGEPGWEREEFYEATGGFGHDASAYGRHGLGRPAYREPPRARATPAGAAPERGRFYGRMPQGYTRSDARIREDVCDQLSLGQVNPSEIAVAVERGVVRLEGFVDSRSEKYFVEELAAATLGVRDVDNHLRVRPDPGDDHDARG